VHQLIEQGAIGGRPVRGIPIAGAKRLTFCAGQDRGGDSLEQLNVGESTQRGRRTDRRPPGIHKHLERGEFGDPVVELLTFMIMIMNVV